MSHSIERTILNHISSGEYSNAHFVHISTGVSTKEQVELAINLALKQTELKSFFKVSLLFKGNLPLGYGYVWFTNPQVANMLVGKNPDSSERFEFVQDPRWVPDYESKLWGDIAEIEDPPKIKRHLPPLLTLPNYLMTPEQIKLAKINDVPILNGKYGTFKCDIGYVSDRDMREENIKPNVLCATRLHPSIVEADLLNLFKPFSSVPNFPIVNITKSRLAFVTFSEKTHDAGFAIKVTKKTMIKKGNENHQLIFNFCKNF